MTLEKVVLTGRPIRRAYFASGFFICNPKGFFQRTHHFYYWSDEEISITSIPYNFSREDILATDWRCMTYFEEIFFGREPIEDYDVQGSD